MKYLLLIVLALGAVSCQTVSEELIKENEALRAQAIEARQMAEEQAVNAKEAQAQAHAAAQVKLCKARHLKNVSLENRRSIFAE